MWCPRLLYGYDLKQENTVIIMVRKSNQNLELCYVKRTSEFIYGVPSHTSHVLTRRKRNIIYICVINIILYASIV